MRVLDKDVYDTLELSALAFGGIGASALDIKGDPWCALGHAEFLDGDTFRGPVRTGLFACLGDSVAGPNNRAVRAINERKNRAPNDRVTWKEWTAELNVVRGA